MSDSPQWKRLGVGRSGDRIPITPISRSKTPLTSPPASPAATPDDTTAGGASGAGETGDRVPVAPISRWATSVAAPTPLEADASTGTGGVGAVPLRLLAGAGGAALLLAAALGSLLNRDSLPGDTPTDRSAESATATPSKSEAWHAGEPTTGEAASPLPPATRREAAQLRGEFEKLAAALAPPIERWANDRYRSALTISREGEEALLDGDATRAAARFRAGLEVLRELDALKPKIIADALEAGFAALRREDGTTAREHFELAAAIDPVDPRAVRGLRRVATLGAVLSATAAAAQRERAGDWGAARDGYAKALALDPEWEPAREGRARAETRVTENQFQEHLSAGVRASRAGRWEPARKNLRAALALRRDSREAREALQQVERKIRLAATARAGEAARGAEVREEWAEAIRHYQALLTLDASLGSARDGLARSQKRLDLDEQIRLVLENPAHLYDPAALRGAQGLATSIAQVQDAGPRLRAQQTKLRESIERAVTPVSVEFRSDNRTEVTIVRVRRLGTFERLQFALRPGTYVITGSRRGYRDVRRTLRVAPSGHPLSVEVQCKEAI